MCIFNSNHYLKKKTLLVANSLQDFYIICWFCYVRKKIALLLCKLLIFYHFNGDLFIYQRNNNRVILIINSEPNSQGGEVGYTPFYKKHFLRIKAYVVLKKTAEEQRPLCWPSKISKKVGKIWKKCANKERPCIKNIWWTWVYILSLTITVLLGFIHFFSL